MEYAVGAVALIGGMVAVLAVLVVKLWRGGGDD